MLIENEIGMDFTSVSTQNKSLLKKPNMEVNTVITTIISSSVIATILSSAINYYLKKQDFKNEYFKKIIDKRLNSYEWLENQIGILKNSVLDEKDGQPYHRIFSLGQDYYLKSIESMSLTNSNNTWLNSLTNEKFTELLHLINKISFEFDTSSEAGLISAGKKYYKDIARLRDELENLTINDFIKLYDFKNIKKKKIQTEFTQKIWVNGK